MRKKFGAIIISTLMLISFSACASESNTSAENSSDSSISSATDNSEKEFLAGVIVDKDEPEETEAVAEEKVETERINYIRSN